eukprot:TRINITY_DN2954_c0_g1_i2.p2 TRINITY_DN2954_c0_g1~~TRINITY_DN2954_c0_g1_i2.p2  ORF type:complete len:294 (-),score=66.23 TRINITY_DN2954_c0_g1_i2:34-915(-)
MDGNISIKLFYGEEVRRFTVPTTSSFSQLLTKCKEILSIPETLDVVLKYMDSDKDYITFSTDEELAYARTIVPDPILRLSVSQKKLPTKATIEDEMDRVKTNIFQSKQKFKELRKMRIEKMKENGKAKPLDAKIVEHVTIPDYSEITCGSKFEKTLKVRNTGAANWPQGCTLVQIDKANDLGAPASVPAPLLGIDEEGVVTVPLVAPSLPGEYATYFKFSAPDGKKFGQRIRCVIFAVNGTSVIPEKINHVWERLESMGFVEKGDRPSQISALIVESKGNLDTIVRSLLDKKQ